jgi:phosphomannomutase
MGVFKTYDVRGVWGQGIDGDLTERVARAFARHQGARRCMVGYDARLHSREMYERVIRGLVAEGTEVTGVGMVSTPLLHFAQMGGGHDTGIMVTASHNPPQYQGMKLFDATGGSVSYAKGLDRIEAMVGSLSTAEPARPGGSLRETDPLGSYLDFVCAAAGNLPAGMRVVIDVSSGSAGRVFRGLAGRLGLEATLLNEEPDGSFPSHSPNPLEEESVRGLIGAVREKKAVLGVILDGDGDRLLFVDERGGRIDNYFMSAVIAEELLSAEPGAAVVYDLISSRVLPERIRDLGGKPRVSRVGYTFLYDNMVESRAVFGAETSGHVYFRVSDRYYTESAAYALAIVLRLLARRATPLSGLVDPLRARYYQMPETNLEVADKEGALRAIEAAYTDGTVDHLDGISVAYPDFWFNVRPSNTEPVLRVRLEAQSRQVAERRAAEIVKLIGSP